MTIAKNEKVNKTVAYLEIDLTSTVKLISVLEQIKLTVAIASSCK